LAKYSSNLTKPKPFLPIQTPTCQVKNHSCQLKLQLAKSKTIPANSNSNLPSRKPFLPTQTPTCQVENHSCQLKLHSCQFKLGLGKINFILAVVAIFTIKMLNIEAIVGVFTNKPIKIPIFVG
jgi:hypothetical protein